jgi:hypothetical protein
VLHRHLPGILLLLSFVIALSFNLMYPPERVARTLFFPGATRTDLSSERRLIPRVASSERAVGLVVQEMLLGPINIAHGRALPRETTINSVMLQDRVVYLDLNRDPILARSDVEGLVETGFEAIRRSILFNFRSINEVVITIEGNVPFVPAYQPPAR